MKQLTCHRGPLASQLFPEFLPYEKKKASYEPKAPLHLHGHQGNLETRPYKPWQRPKLLVFDFPSLSQTLLRPEDTNPPSPSDFGLFIPRSCRALSTSASLTTPSTESVSSPVLTSEPVTHRMGGWLIFLTFLRLWEFSGTPQERRSAVDSKTLYPVYILYIHIHYIFPELGGVHSTAHTHFIFLPSKVFLEIVSEKSRYSLHQNMDKIKVPTQIIWGKQDQVCGVPRGCVCQLQQPPRTDSWSLMKGAWLLSDTRERWRTPGAKCRHSQGVEGSDTDLLKCVTVWKRACQLSFSKPYSHMVQKPWKSTEGWIRVLSVSLTS